MLDDRTEDLTPTQHGRLRHALSHTERTLFALSATATATAIVPRAS